MFCAQIDDLSLSSILFLADEKRETFILQETKKKHFVRRPYIYEDVIVNKLTKSYLMGAPCSLQ